MKLKRNVKIILGIIIIGIICAGSYRIYQIHFKDNDQIVSSEIDKLMKDNNINKSNYSKTLEYVLLNNIYDEKYLNEYKDIDFKDISNFGTILTTFLPKGYSGKEINYLTNLSDKNIEILSDMDYTNISNYYMINNFDASKIERYNNYKNNTNYSYQDVVTYVNINLDLPVYTNTKTVDDPNSLLVLVNKYNCLPDNYSPSDLIYLPGAYGNNVPMREVLKESFLKLQNAAKEEININLMPSTAYRSESLQATLYNNYVASDGKEKADTYSARPGCSEHQTGLAIDLRNVNLGTTGTRLTDENYKWLEDNAYKYGFIIRFPKEKEFVTGYQFENWHIRYVGMEAAKIIYDNNLTLEEYIDLYITEY